MLGRLIDSLDDPNAARRVIAALADPALEARLDAAATAAGRAPADVLAATVRGFLDSASDDHWTQLMGLMNRAEDPGLAALRAILKAALPASPTREPGPEPRA